MLSWIIGNTLKDQTRN